MGVLIPVTSQDKANSLLREWQSKRHLKPEQRLEAYDELERHMEILRQLMERSR